MRRVPRLQVVMVVLVIAIAWQLVQLTWLLLDRGPQPQPATAPPPMNVAPVRSGVDIQAIVNAHLFDVAGRRRPHPMRPMRPATASEPGAVSGFRLRGSGQGPGHHRRVGAGGKVFAVGSMVRPGLKLHSGVHRPA